MRPAEGRIAFRLRRAAESLGTFPLSDGLRPNPPLRRWGHKWIVLAIVVKFPFATRPWALPVLCALHRPEELNRAEGRRHRTPAELARGLMAALLHWFPERKFVFLGDGGYASHELAAFCHRHRQRVSVPQVVHLAYDRLPESDLLVMYAVEAGNVHRSVIALHQRVDNEPVVEYSFRLVSPARARSRHGRRAGKSRLGSVNAGCDDGGG